MIQRGKICELPATTKSPKVRKFIWKNTEVKNMFEVNLAFELAMGFPISEPIPMFVMIIVVTIVRKLYLNYRSGRNSGPPDSNGTA